MNIEAKISRLEEAAGMKGGRCVLCEAREAKAAEQPPRRDDLEYREGERFTMDCPTCGRPFDLVIVYVERRRAA